MAICFYQNDQGYARAWLVYLESEDAYIIFNGYGFSGDATLRITQIFARFMGYNYKQIILRNHHASSGTLWINSGRGYVIALSVDDWTSYDLEFEVSHALVCHSCERALDEDDAHHGLDDEWYCETCFYEEYDYCGDCGNTIHRDAWYYVDWGVLCERCYTRDYHTCSHCGEAVAREDVKTGKDGLVYCQGCFDR